MYKTLHKPLLLILFCLSFAQVAKAQLTVSAQVRTRSEYRNGQGTPQIKDTIPAFFTSQRTRLNVGYAGYRFKLYTSIQDVRVWGQDASTINRTTNDVNDGFLVHEAWGEISLVDTGKVVKNFSLKIGRQELVYDDARLLGNLDWLQQARRHDAAVLKFDHKGWTANIGAAYNQNAERKSNSIYNGTPTGYVASTNGIGTNYKSLQFLYVAKKLHFGSASLLAVKDDFSKFSYAPTDVAKANPIYERRCWNRYTAGVNLVGTAIRKLSFGATAFYQGGKYREGTNLNEYLFSLSTSYAITRKLSMGPGVDYTSGNNGSDPTKTNQRFDPLYGTPHKFWGYMDYFYVADGFKSNGLIDYYFRTKFKAKDNLTIALDLHEFVLPNAVKDSDGVTNMSKQLGQEIDFVVNYGLSKVINIEAGYSAMFSTSTMLSTKVKGTAKVNDNTASKTSDWAYLMISIKPEFLFKN
jgi:hypothetical protein